MNRKQAKDLLPIIQGYVDGKKIEKRPKGRYDVEWQETVLPAFNPHTCDYRIKPKPKYRPFANAEECWQEMQKHQPFGWIKASHGQFLIIKFRNNEIAFGTTENWLRFKYVFDNYTFADGTPFGIKEE